MPDEKPDESGSGAVLLALRETHTLRQGERTLIVGRVMPGAGASVAEAEAMLGRADAGADLDQDLREWPAKAALLMAAGREGGPEAFREAVDQLFPEPTEPNV